MLKNKAQSLTEYSICLAILLIALISMNFYVKRGLQGRYKDVAHYAWIKVMEAADIPAIGNDSTLTEDARRRKIVELWKPQYEPYYQDSTNTNTLARKVIGTTIKVGGQPPRGNFNRTLPAIDKDEKGQDKPVNLMSAGGESRKETEKGIKNALP